MNNGHPSPQDTVPDFFTSGAGTNSENENNFEPENNLDLTNTTTDWELPMPDRDQRKIGSQAIASAESLNFSAEAPVPTPEEDLAAKINAITENKAAPVALNPAITQAETPPVPEQFEKSHIKTDDRLSDTAVAAIDQAKAKLDQDGDIATFYDTARNMMEVNLENSYNRKLAAWNT